MTPAARRVARSLRGALLYLIPSLWLALPNLTPLFVLALFLPAAGGALLVAISDEVSLSRRDGEDSASERRISWSLLLIFTACALDTGRLHWLLVPEGAQLAGLVLLVLGYGLRATAMYTNRFFASVLVVQSDRQHEVVDRGPYAWIRHPGNTSAILICLALPLALGSLLGAAGALAGVWVVLDRTRREDAFLHARLPGYGAYAARVPAKLVPGVF